MEIHMGWAKLNRLFFNKTFQTHTLLTTQLKAHEKKIKEDSNFLFFA